MEPEQLPYATPVMPLSSVAASSPASPNACSVAASAYSATVPMERVVFDVFSARDEALYRAALARPSAP